MPDDESADNLIEPEGVNAGSRYAERDREVSESPPVRPRAGEPKQQAPPAERLVGPPDQQACTPGQELAAG